MFSWMAAQGPIVEKAKEVVTIAEENEEPLSPLTVFRPVCSDSPQIVLFQETVTGILQNRLGLVFAVYRGSVSRAQNATRRLRVSKALGIHAPAEAVAKITILKLKKLPGNEFEYAASCLSEACILDPFDVVCEVPTTKSGEQNGVRYFQVNKSTEEIIQKLDSGDLQIEALLESPEKVEKETKLPEHVENHRIGFTPLDFPKNPSGRENIRKFFAQLPDSFKAHGIQLLDKKACITVNKKIHTWSSMTARCVVWFETVDAEKKKDAHSNGVCHKLAQLFGCYMMRFGAVVSNVAYVASTVSSLSQSHHPKKSKKIERITQNTRSEMI